MDYPDAIYPAVEDLIGAALALTRLQETYFLEVAELAEGTLKGVTYSSKMSAGDCYELGKILYDLNEFKYSLAWMMSARQFFYEENNEYPFKEIDILEYISMAHNSLGNVTEAFEWIKKVLKIDPKMRRALISAKYYERKIKKNEKKKQQTGDIGKKIDFQRNPLERHWYMEEKEKKVFEALCRGEQEIPSQISKRFKCFYLTGTHPFLRLAPIKMEYKYLNPDIVMFYDVLNNQEIEELKKLAKPRLHRATVFETVSHTPTQSVTVVSRDRISKLAWLKDVESPLVERVSRRAADITGFDLTTAEHLQVVNYGIAGHYIPHTDFDSMSDVYHGGATVFTELGLSLMPVRGAAVVWLNLHSSGRGNNATRHASCPVLLGDKWVCSKWFHQVGQEFIKPCGLNYEKQ